MAKRPKKNLMIGKIYHKMLLRLNTSILKELPHFDNNSEWPIRGHYLGLIPNFKSTIPPWDQTLKYLIIGISIHRSYWMILSMIQPITLLFTNHNIIQLVKNQLNLPEFDWYPNRKFGKTIIT